MTRPDKLWERESPIGGSTSKHNYTHQTSHSMSLSISKYGPSVLYIWEGKVLDSMLIDLIDCVLAAFPVTAAWQRGQQLKQSSDGHHAF